MMPTSDDSSCVRTPDAADLAEELRLLPLEEENPDTESPERRAEIQNLLLRIAEHLDAHEQALFKQRESLRSQLMSVRAEVQRERQLLEEARALRATFAPRDSDTALRAQSDFAAETIANAILAPDPTAHSLAESSTLLKLPEHEPFEEETFKVPTDRLMFADEVELTHVQPTEVAIGPSGEAQETIVSAEPDDQRLPPLSVAPIQKRTPERMERSLFLQPRTARPKGKPAKESKSRGSKRQAISGERNRVAGALGALFHKRESFPVSIEKETSPAPVATATPRQIRLDMAEVAVTWRSAVPAAALCLFLAAILGWGTIDSLRAHQSKRVLLATVQAPQSGQADIAELLADQPSTLLGGLDADGQYIRARAFRRIEQIGKDEGGTETDDQNRAAMLQSIDEAIALAPANVWYKLTKARLADQLGLGAELSAAAWESAALCVIADPLYSETIADHFAKTGEKDWALTAYSTVLEKYPERTGDALRRLAAAGVKRKDYLDIVPLHPESILAATRFLKSAGHSDWWTYPRKPLTELSKQIANRPDSELDAIVELCRLVGKSDDTLPILKLAVERSPDRNDWKILLAQVRYERKELEECDRLARDVISTDPSGEHAKTARTLLEKLELAGNAGLLQGLSQQTN